MKWLTSFSLKRLHVIANKIMAIAIISIVVNSCSNDNDGKNIRVEKIHHEPSKKQNQSLLDLAKELESKNRYNEAITAYKQAIEESTCLNEAIPLWLKVAEIYRKNKQFEESLRELNALNVLLPANQEVKKKRLDLLVELGKTAAQQGDSKSALENFKLALDANPANRLHILREYADQLSFASQAHLAIPLYQEVLDSNPSSDEKKMALIGLARAYIWRENYDEAIKTNQKVLEIDPHYDQYDFFLTLARDAASHQKHDIAAEYYKKAMDARSGERNALFRDYAKQLSYAYRATEAIALYKEVLLNGNLSPEENRLIHLDLAQAYVWTKQFPLAISEYETLISQNPNDSEARNALADLFISFARFEAKNYQHTTSLNWFLSAMSLDPNRRVILLREYADEVSRSGHGPEAIALYQELLANQLSPEERRLAKLGLAQTYIWVNNHKEALKIYQELLNINPNDADARKGMVQVYLDYARYDAGQGNRAMAIEWFKKAIEIDPAQKPVLLKELADQLYYNSQVDEAIALYKEILCTQPTGEYERSVYLNLAQAYTNKFQYEEALKAYDYLLQKNKYDQIAKQGKAKIYVDYALYNSRQHKHAEAIESYKQAMENDPIRRPEFLLKIEEEEALLHGKGKSLAIPQVVQHPTTSTVTEQPKEDRAAFSHEQDYPVPAPIIIETEQPKEDNAQQQNRPIPAPAIIENEPIKKVEEEKLQIPEKIETESCPNTAQKSFLSKTLPDDFSMTCEQKEVAFFSKSSCQPDANFSAQENLNKCDAFKKTTKYASNLEERRKEDAKKAYDQGQEYVKRLEVFEANRAFQASIDLDPDNRGYRETYAWHLEVFSFFEEAVGQFNILLPDAKDQNLFYQVLGWEWRALGQLEQSIWAFSHLYSIPCNYTYNYKFILIGDLFRRSEYKKINGLWDSLAWNCEEDSEKHAKSSLEAKKKLFESYTYVGNLTGATALAVEILSAHPEEYMVHYRYAKLLHQKKLYCEAVIQYQLLIEKLPENAFLYLTLGKVYEDMGEICNAKAAYEKALALDQNPRTERAYARVLSKLNYCCEAKEISNQIPLEENNELTKLLSTAEVSLNCGDYEIAAAIYNQILCDYPYNQEALWGLLKSSTYTRNSADARISYRRWPTVWFDDPLQNRLAPYYRPPEMVLQTEYFENSTSFTRFATGIYYDDYAFCNTRLYEGYYYTRFSQQHFNTINRQSLFLGAETLFNKKWEGRARLIENYYDRLQHESDEDSLEENHLFSKAVLNYHLHLVYHPIPEVSVDFGYDYYDVIDTVPPFANPIYNYSNQIGATALNIRTSDWSVFFQYYKDKVSIIGNFIYGNYSDGNTKLSDSFRIGYQFSEIPVSNVFYSYFYLDYQKRAPLFTQNGHSESAYYDPKNFEVHLIGVDSKYDITEKLQIGGEGALLFFPKANNIGYSAFGYLNYQFTDCWAIRLDMRYYYQNRSVLRDRISGFYNAKNANLQITKQF